MILPECGHVFFNSPVHTLYGCDHKLDAAQHKFGQMCFKQWFLLNVIQPIDKIMSIFTFFFFWWFVL